MEKSDKLRFIEPQDEFEESALFGPALAEKKGPFGRIRLWMVD